MHFPETCLLLIAESASTGPASRCRGIGCVPPSQLLFDYGSGGIFGVLLRVWGARAVLSPGPVCRPSPSSPTSIMMAVFCFEHSVGAGPLPPGI